MNNLMEEQELFDWISDAVCISSSEGVVLYANHALERLFGVSSDQLKGQYICDGICSKLYDSELINCSENCPLRFDRKESSICFRGSFSFSRTQIRHLRVHCFRRSIALTREDAPKESLYRVMFIEDISAEIRLENCREDWRRMVIHDLRSPLTSIAAVLDMLLNMHPVTSDQNHLLELGQRASAKMLSLLNLYLDVEKLKSGDMPVHPSQVCLSETIERCVSEIKPLADRQQIIVGMAVIPSLEVYADSALLTRVIQNLLDNAVKYNLYGGRILISGKVTGENKVKISIHNSGPGIALRDLPHIFERYYQAESSWKGNSMSTGLGLTFCKEALKVMQGSIDVTSVPGQYSEFFFVLPLYVSNVEMRSDSLETKNERLLQCDRVHKAVM